MKAHAQAHGESTERAPLASIIIPATKVDAWLEESIDSALASDYPEIEVIVVLNGAPPGVAPRQHLDRRVRLLRYPERVGSAGGSIKGLGAARGKYYFRLDADDLMAPTRVSQQVEYLRHHPDATLVSSRADWIDEGGRVIGAFAYAAGADVRIQLTRENVVVHPAIAARVADIVAVGGYDSSLQQMEDYDLALRLALRGRVAVIDEVLTHYRLHDSQMSRAVQPTGRYIRTILRRRRTLAHLLGTSRLATIKNDTWWLAQQWGMFVVRRVTTRRRG